MTEITFTQYIMSCLQKDAMEKYWRENGKKANDEITDSKDKTTSDGESTSRTIIKPVG